MALQVTSKYNQLQLHAKRNHIILLLEDMRHIYRTGKNVEMVSVICVIPRK